MKTQDVLFAFLATGLIASCTAAPERELHGEFGITGFNLVDGEEGALMELLVDGEELYVEGENFRVSLAASEDAVAPPIDVREGDRLALVAISAEGERAIGQLVIDAVELPSGFIEGSYDSRSDDITTQATCTNGSTKCTCTIQCCSVPGTSRLKRKYLCVYGTWYSAGTCGCCGASTCAY